MDQIELFEHLIACKQMTELLVLHSNTWNHLTVYKSYLPTPPLGQDMTQGQFLSGV